MDDQVVEVASSNWPVWAVGVTGCIAIGAAHLICSYISHRFFVNHIKEMEAYYKEEHEKWVAEHGSKGNQAS